MLGLLFFWLLKVPAFIIAVLIFLWISHNNSKRQEAAREIEQAHENAYVSEHSLLYKGEETKK